MKSREFNRLKQESLADGSSLLFAMSTFYLATPIVIFIIYWIKPILIPIVLIPLVFALKSEIIRLNWSMPFIKNVRNSVPKYVIPMILATIWTCIFGAGVLGPKTGDQMKNLAIFKELSTHSWPVIFENFPVNFDFLSYPLGYYLVPSAMAKLFGWHTGQVCVSIWTTLGVGLLFSWLRYFFPRKYIFAILLFICFSGLDVFGFLFKGFGLPAAGTHLEWWSGWTFMQYSSNATVMAWSTQHAMAQWLVPCLLLYWFRKSNLKLDSFILLCTIGSFWSHLTIIGLIIFVPAIKRDSWKDLTRIQNLYSIPFLTILVTFYSSKSSTTIPMDLIWRLWPTQYIATWLPLFLFLEFLFLAAILTFFSKFDSGPEKVLFYAAIVLLCCIPVVHIGWSNDFSMRVSAVPLFVLFYFTMKLIDQTTIMANSGLRILLLSYFFFASFTPMNEMYRQVSQIFPQSFFTSSITDVNWNSGINRQNSNCLITQIPRSFDVRPGDKLQIHGQGTFTILIASITDGFQNICINSTAGVNHKVSPDSSIKLDFKRGNARLNGRFQLYYFYDETNSPNISSFSPEQYTGSKQSLFFNFIIRK
ncbi:hypothetical protein MCERE85_01416 [Candidatus Nanopelagicaceae bacterium]